MSGAVERTVKSTQEQAIAAWITHLNQMRLDTLIEKLNRQDINLEEALKELEKIKQFIGDPAHILGSVTTKHGEIAEHKPQVQDNVKSGGDGEKYQWYYGISQRPKQRCEKIVEKDSGESCKDHDQILMHQSF